MLESDFWQEFRGALPEPHWQRIESGLTAQGIPDTNGCLEGVEAWVELKSMNRGIQIPKYTPFQVAWQVQRARAGGRVFIAVRVQKPDWKGLILFPGIAARELKDQGLGLRGVGELRLPESIDYNAVRAHIFGPTVSHYKRAWT